MFCRKERVTDQSTAARRVIIGGWAPVKMFRRRHPNLPGNGGATGVQDQVKLSEQNSEFRRFNKSG
jgi:hypothetical protein